MKRKLQTEHDRITRSLANYLISHNYSDVRADIEGYNRPYEITWKATGAGHIPDVVAIKGQPQIFEVETEDSINDNHTEDQWKLFAAHANNTNGYFTVVVPQGCSQTAKERLNQLNIQAEVWEA